MIDHLYIKRLAVGAGFDLCGIAPCRHLAENEALFRAWLARGRQSSLGYLERNVDKRFDARRLVEGARTAVVCAVSYKNRVGEGYPPGHRTKVASYACAADYHATLRTMLGGMLDALRAAHPGLGGRACEILGAESCCGFVVDCSNILRRERHRRQQRDNRYK